jgi:hypothetical protein
MKEAMIGTDSSPWSEDSRARAESRVQGRAARGYRVERGRKGVRHGAQTYGELGYR